MPGQEQRQPWDFHSYVKLDAKVGGCEQQSCFRTSLDCKPLHCFRVTRSPDAFDCLYTLQAELLLVLARQAAIDYVCRQHGVDALHWGESEIGQPTAIIS